MIEQNFTEPTAVNQQPKKRRTPILIAIASIILVAGAGAVTAGILKQTVTKKSTPSTVRLLSAKEAYGEITKSGAVVALGNEQYDFSSWGTGNIAYKDAAKSYAITTSTPYSGYYTLKKDKTAESSGTVASQVESILKAAGLSKVQSPLADSNTTKNTFFASDSTICQLISSSTKSELATVVMHTVSCADKASLVAAYKQIDDLLSLSKTDIKATSGAPTVSLTTNTKDHVAYSIVTIQSDKLTSLLYGAVDGKYEYIANVGEGNAADNNGKYFVSPETKTKISDAKYGGFLLQEIAGSDGKAQ